MARVQRDILVDVTRSFTTDPRFTAARVPREYLGGAALSDGEADLFEVLRGFALLDQSTGYCQGANFIAGFMLTSELRLSAEDAFIVLVFLLRRLGLSAMFEPGLPLVVSILGSVEAAITAEHPRLDEALRGADVTAPLFVMHWIMTLWTRGCAHCLAIRSFRSFVHTHPSAQQPAAPAHSRLVVGPAPYLHDWC